jgi:hypothetical protein
MNLGIRPGSPRGAYAAPTKNPERNRLHRNAVPIIVAITKLQAKQARPGI